MNKEQIKYLRKKLKENYFEYIKTNYWKKLQEKILARDKHMCVDCQAKTDKAYHVTDYYILTNEEIDYCVSLCDDCFDRRCTSELKELYPK